MPNSVGGRNSVLREISIFLIVLKTVRLVFRDVLDYKFHINRSTDWNRKKFFDQNFFSGGQKTSIFGHFGVGQSKLKCHSSKMG